MKKHILAWILAMACMASLHGGVEPDADDTQILNLNAGWNWVSFNILPSSRKVGDVLGTAGFTANDVIQSSTGSSRFNGVSWIPSTFTVEYGKLYMVYVSKPVSLTLAGAESSSSTLSVSSGWNWIQTRQARPSRRRS